MPAFAGNDRGWVRARLSSPAKAGDPVNAGAAMGQRRYWVYILALIEKDNPNWDDLYPRIAGG